MIVKNITINNKIIIDSIIKELCKNNISYVYIEEANELHFKNYIFRFYENFFIYSRIGVPIWEPKKTQEKIKNDDKDKKKKIIPELILKKSYIPNQQNYPNIYL